MRDRGTVYGAEIGIGGTVAVLEAGVGWRREINAEAFDPVVARIVEASCL